MTYRFSTKIILLGLIFLFPHKASADTLQEINDLKNKPINVGGPLGNAQQTLNNAADGIDSVIQTLKDAGVSDADIQKVVDTIGVDPRTIASNIRSVAQGLTGGSNNYEGLKRYRDQLQAQINNLNDSKSKIEAEASTQRDQVANLDGQINKARADRHTYEADYRREQENIDRLWNNCWWCPQNLAQIGFWRAAQGIASAGMFFEDREVNRLQFLRYFPGIIVDMNNAKTEPYRIAIDALQKQINAVNNALRDQENQITTLTNNYLCKEVRREGSRLVTGEYFNNKNLSGSPQMVKGEKHLYPFSVDWGIGPPKADNNDPSLGPVGENVIDCGMNADNWSARITTTFSGGGTYQFTTKSDDGVRLSVDDHLLIDDWHDHPVTTNTALVALANANHKVKIEYYDNTGYASLYADWKEISGCNLNTPLGNDRWKGEYFNNKELQGIPWMVRDDGVGPINFDWGYGSPNTACGLGADNFSVRWTRSVPFENKTYTFTATSDDGMRVYIDGVRKINQWRDQAPTTATISIPMTAGNHTIKVEYYDHMFGAVAKLKWKALQTPAPPQPPLVTPPHISRQPVLPPRPVRRNRLLRTGKNIVPASKPAEFGLPPPPPPSQIVNKPQAPKEEPKPIWTPPSAAPREPEQENAVKLPQQREEPTPHCGRGTWSPTLKRCIEEEVPQEAPHGECNAGMHWSPTLKSCQPD